MVYFLVKEHIQFILLISQVFVVFQIRGQQCCTRTGSYYLFVHDVKKNAPEEKYRELSLAWPAPERKNLWCICSGVHREFREFSLFGISGWGSGWNTLKDRWVKISVKRHRETSIYVLTMLERNNNYI